MSTVDNRIVNMQFNNKEFESRVQTTLKSLNNLKSSLKLDESAKSLENLQEAGKKFSLDGIGRGVEAISGKFSALGIIGVTALANITNSAINAGKQIVSALTIDPIKMGFQEYETQINAVQTILANTSSKGTTITDVNKALDELNAYADRTIYNFTEMTRNIGTFTAAGVDLDTSVQAIKGIANLAAVSGSTSQQASTAMYQLSQALSSGTVKLQDWNSVVNAGMGGQVFQDALKETARVHKINIDAMIKQEGSFRETLQNGWLTSEILTETLAKFTGDLNEEQLKTMGYTKDQIKSIMEMGQMANDAATKVKTFTQLFDTLKEAAQSGWTQSWEIIVGDFEEAKELLTEVSDVFSGIIGASADARNSMLQGWKDLGGRASLIEAVRNAFQGIMDVIAPVKEAFREIFPPMTGEQLFNITKGIEELTKKFKMGETTLANIKSTFKGVFALIDIGVMAIKAFAKGAADLFGSILPVGDGLLGITGGIGDFIVGVRDAIKAGDLFNKVIGGITSVLKVAIGWVEGLVKAINESFANIDLSGLEAFATGVQVRFAPLEAIGNAIKWVFGGLIGVIQKAIPIAAGFASMVGEAFSGLTDAITGAFTSGDFSKVLDIFNTGLLGGLIYGLKKFVDSLTGITDSAGGFLEGITGILDGVKGSLEAYQSTLKAKTLITIAGAIAILAASLTVLSMIDSDKLTVALTAMTAMFIELFGAMAVFEKIMASSGFKGMGKVSIGMIAMSTAVLILSAALKNLAGLNWADLLVGLGGVAGLMVILTKSVEAMSKSSGKVIKGSTGLIVFAGAILILTKAVESLSTLNVGELTKGLVGVGVLCAELALFLKMADFDGFGMLKGAGLMLLAGAINILASAVAKISQMDWGKMIQGLVGVGALLAGLSIFSNSLKNTKGVISAAVAATILGGAMHILAGAVEKLGVMPFDVIKQGLIGMGAALAGIIITMNLLPKDMMSKSVGMVALASAMLILSKALSSMGSLTEQQFITSMAALAGSLTILVVAMKFMTVGLAGAAAMLVMSSALVVLAGALKIMGSMSLPELGMALLTLVSSLAILGGAAALLAPLTPVMLALAGAFALFGVATAAIGGGILALSVGLGALAVSGTAGVAALVAAVTAIISLVPMFIQKIGEGIILFADVLIKGGPKIYEAGKVMLLGFINALIDVVPRAVEGILILLTSLLTAIADNMPEYVQAGFDILLAFLKGIRDNIGEVVDVAIDIVINFLDALSKKWIDVVDAGFELIIDFIDSLGKSIRENTPRVVTAIIGLGENIIQGLVDALFAGVNKVKEAIANVGKNLIDKFKETLGITPEGCKKFKDMAGDIINGLINGFKEKVANIKDAAAELGDNIVNAVKNKLGIKSPSRVMRDEVGRWVVEGLAEGIKYNTSAEEAAEQKAKNIVSAFKKELDKFDLDATTADLEYQLWESLKGDKATDAEKAQMEANLLANKLKLQTEKVAYAQGEYTVTAEKMGKNSEAAQEAYNKYLKSQIELANLSKQLTTLQETESKRQQQAQIDYYNYLTENMQVVRDGHLTYEELAKNATSITGYDPAAMKQDMKSDVTSAVTEAMAVVQTAYSETADKTFGGLVDNYSNWGAEYATALSNAINLKSPLVVNSTTAMMNDCIAKLREYVDDWKIVGSNLVDGLIAGIEENIARAKAAAAELASMTLTSAKEELDVNSPSKKFEELGRFSAIGLARGLIKYGRAASNAASQLGDSAIEGLRDSIKKIAEVATNDIDMNPTIRPVIDLSNIKAGEKELNSIFDRTRGISVNTSINRASAISNRMATDSDSKINTQPTQAATYTFTQNNYSPKALSQIEIYRQTKNQFSAFKGVVSAK